MPAEGFRNRCAAASLFLLLVMGSLAAAVPATAEAPDGTREVQVIGNSRIYKGNVPGARAAAIAGGLVAAVDGLVVELLPAEVRTRRFFDLGRLLHDRTGSFVQDYRVMTEAQVEKTYRVMVAATVLVDELSAVLKEAGLLTEQRALPAVLVFMRQQGLDDSEPGYWWKEDFAFVQARAESTFNTALAARGLRVIPHIGIGPAEAVRAINYDPLPDDTVLAAIGRELGAEVVVVGDARAERAPNTMGGELRAYKAALSVRALRTGDGLEIASAEQQTVGLHPEDLQGEQAVLAEAGRLAGEQLAAALVTAWKSPASGGGPIEIHIQGSGVLSHFVAFRQVAQTVPGVQEVLVREMTSDSALLDVAYADGDARTLADALILKTFDAFGIHIYDVLPGKLMIELIPE